ncbi:DUF6318 family protein [Janibacter indicus]
MAFGICALTACADGESRPAEPSADSTKNRSAAPPSSSASSSSTSSLGSNARQVADLPEEAKAQTKEGAIAFNEWYHVQMGQALKTGESSTLRAYSRGCAMCDEFAKSVDGYAKKGTRMNVNPNSVTRSSARERDDSGYRVEVDVHASSYHEVLQDKSKGRTADAIDITLVSNTQWTGKQWHIRAMAVTDTW